jgi:hypothetical protein
MTQNGGLRLLWPTPIGVHRYADASRLNPQLVEAFGQIRAVQQRKRGQQPGAFFASDDDLLQVVKLSGWRHWVDFLVSSVNETVTAANEEAWAGQITKIGVGIEGMWFQTSSSGTFHDVHTHGNCSWSGVYIVQIDESAKRIQHPVYGAANGVTRLYGQNFVHLGGAFVDAGNAYLMPPSQDIEPIAGQLLLFPSWLAHMALPYQGDLERVIISFNFSVHGLQGDQLLDYSAT